MNSGYTLGGLPMFKLRHLTFSEIWTIKARCGHPQIVPVATTVRKACYKCIHGLTHPVNPDIPELKPFVSVPAIREIEPHVIEIDKKMRHKPAYLPPSC